MERGNEIFARVLDWLYANGKVDNQKTLSERTGIDKTTISRILNNQVKKPSDETLRRLNAAFGNIFNPAYLRGDSEVMLLADVGNEPMPAASVQPGYVQPMPDYGTMVNAIIAANDTAITSLKREVASKDETIASLKEQLRVKDRYIAMLEQRDRSGKSVSDSKEEEELKKYPFSLGVAETAEAPKP